VGSRPLETAQLLSVGTELTLGETQDTNSGHLARELTAFGVEVQRITALPDVLGEVAEAFEQALERVDLVISTGGLGPTPDDLTREAIAAACRLETHVDPELETWLRDLFERRGLVMSDTNRKQAWLVEGATALPNDNGTAPGWWVDRPDGRVVIALPGPPREMEPIWRQQVVPLLHRRGVGGDRSWHTLRLTGIGESALVDIIGEPLLRATNPQVATYSRADAVDVRIGAVGDGVRRAAEIVEATVDDLMPRLAPYVFGRGAETWPDALGRRLDGRTVAAVEIGTAGQFGALVGGAPWFAFGETLAPRSALASAHGDTRHHAARVRQTAGADIGVCVRARQRSGDTAVTVAVAIGDDVERRTRTAFLGGEMGRRRAALAACAVLWDVLGSHARADPRPGRRGRPDRRGST
jgi:nicotinamide-nucleotide amidase